MRLHPHEVAIGILDDEFETGIFPDPNSTFDGKAGALEFLRSLTEEDFGHDCVKWRQWFSSCPRDMLDLHYDEWYRKAIANTRDDRKRHAGVALEQRHPASLPQLWWFVPPNIEIGCWVCEHILGRVQA